MKRLLDLLVGNKEAQVFNCQEEAKYAAYQPHNNALLVVYRSSIEQVDVESGKRIWTITNPDCVHLCAIYHQDLNYLITGDRDGKCRVYQATTGSLLFILGNTPCTNSYVSSSEVVEVGTVNPLDKEMIDTFGFGHISEIYNLVSISSDLFLSGSIDGTVRLWSLTKQKQEKVFCAPGCFNLETCVDKHPLSITALAYDDTRRVVTVGHMNGNIRQYEYETGKKILELGNKETRQVSAMAILTRTDFLVFSNSSDITRIWDLSADDEHSRFNFNTTAMLYNLNHDILFTGNTEGDIIVWKGVMNDDVHDQEDDRKLLDIKRVKGHSSGIVSLWYHPDEDILVTASRDKNIIIWKSVFQNAIKSLDSSMRKLVLADIDIQIRNLDRKMVSELVREVRDKPEVELQTLSKVTSERKNAYQVIESLLANHHLSTEQHSDFVDVPIEEISNIQSPVLVARLMQKKMEQLEQYLKEELDLNREYVINNREIIFENYKNFIEPNDKVILKEMETDYVKQWKEMKSRHKQEKQELQKRYKEMRIKFEKEKRKQNQKAAKAYQSVKNIYQQRMQDLDTTCQTQIREMINAINIGTEDKDKSEFSAIDDQYKLLYPLSDRSKRVFACIDLKKHEVLAMKLLPVGISIADHIIGPAIVPVREIICSDRHTFVVMKKMEMSLRMLLDETPTYFTEVTAADMLRKAIQGLKYLNSIGIVHRDLRPDTILLDQITQPYLAHLGVMRAVAGVEINENGAYYSAPEVFGKSIVLESDIWSLGCLAAYMLQSPEERSTKPLICGETTEDIFKKIFSVSRPSDSDFKKFIRTLVNDVTLRTEMKDYYIADEDPQSNIPILREHISQASDSALEFIGSCLQLIPSRRKSYTELEQSLFFTCLPPLEQGTATTTVGLTSNDE